MNRVVATTSQFNFPMAAETLLTRSKRRITGLATKDSSHEAYGYIQNPERQQRMLNVVESSLLLESLG
ncbi:hypothetical protein JTE90_016952 [Oedothorax gibbosus]|uniref:Uncharacterized protein n=1 Tax=Oedothorax gibbosus TaxID=931172 RepID=A0AAV6TLY2_9ARAC|nr:hypothetical protein JTE90_016952 [Oedothorax gibbosus]